MTGIRATLRNMTLAGNVEHLDTTREMALSLEGTRLTGAITGTVWAISDIKVAVDAASRWTATADSRVTLVGATDAARFDAPAGITITALAGQGTTLKGRYPLAGGGLLVVKS